MVLTSSQKPTARLFGILCKFTNYYSWNKRESVISATERISAAMAISEELEDSKSAFAFDCTASANSSTGELENALESWEGCIWIFHLVCSIMLQGELLRSLDVVGTPVFAAGQAHLVSAYKLRRHLSESKLKHTAKVLRKSLLQLPPYLTGRKQQPGVFILIGSLQALANSEENSSQSQKWVHDLLAELYQKV